MVSAGVWGGGYYKREMIMISKSKHALRGSGETLLRPYACLEEWHVGLMKLRDAHDAH